MHMPFAVGKAHKLRLKRIKKEAQKNRAVYEAMLRDHDDPQALVEAALLVQQRVREMLERKLKMRLREEVLRNKKAAQKKKVTTKSHNLRACHGHKPSKPSGVACSAVCVAASLAIHIYFCVCPTYLTPRETRRFSSKATTS